MNLTAMKIFLSLKCALWILAVSVVLLIGCKTQQPVTPVPPQEDQAQPAKPSADTTLFQSKVETILGSEGGEPIETAEKFNIKDFAVQRDVINYLKKSDVFSSHFTGFCLLDIAKNQVVVDYNADKYFTPASNVKILTLYAALRSFGDKLPGALVRETADTLFIRPIGDPTFLNQYFDKHPLLEKITRTNKPVTIEWPTEELDSFGIGWMWDDYNSGYMPELSWMPIYGNIVRFQYERYKIKAQPGLFNELVEIQKNNTRRSNTVKRAPNFNHFSAEIRYPNWSFEKDVPFKYSKSLVTKLLSDTSKMSVQMGSFRKLKMDTLYSQPTDTVLRRIMQDSDNFLSEQLLIMTAWKNGFTDQEKFREFVIDKWLNDISPEWVDGSGLSRYNLSRPLDQVRLLQKIYQEYGWSKVHNLFPKGGKSGTIRNWYKNTPDPTNPEKPSEPYILGKTGTLSNVHNLSGFLITKSGKLMAFSFMNNHFVRPTNEIKEGMQELLEGIRDAY